MKKILLLLSLFFGVILNAQPFKVDFHVNQDGRFIRTDSEQQYYVFNVDSSYTAEKITERFYNKIMEMRDLPRYFENDLPLGSIFDDKTGIISVRTPYVSLRRNGEKHRCDVMFVSKFKIQFKDGRFRIDPPDLAPSIDAGDRTMKQWLSTSFSGISTAKFTDDIANAMINLILEYVWKEPEEWPQPIEYKDEDNYLLSLADGFKYQFPGGKDYIVFSVPGVSQETIHSAFGELLSLMTLDNFYSYFSAESSSNHKICMIGYQEVLGMRFQYRMLFEFKDEMIKVYVPIINDIFTWSHTIGNDIDYINFTSYLVANKIYTSDGKPAKTNQRNKFDNAVTAKFNRLVFDPVGAFYKALEESKKPEEEW